MASRRNPGALKVLRSSASITQEKRRQLRSHTYVIHPFSMFRHYWNILMVFVMITLLVLVPHQVAFQMIMRPRSWIIAKNSLLLICCLDIVVNLTTGYVDDDEYMVVLEPTKIMNRYLKSSIFLSDLLGSLPTDLFYLNIWYSYKVARKVTSLVCIFRSFSLGSYMGNLAYVYDTPLAVYEFCIIIFWLLIALHWQACFYWLMPIVTTSLQKPMRPSNDTWIHIIDIWEASTGTQYLASMLRAVTTFLRGGLMRTNSSNHSDVYLVILFQLLGTVAPWILVTRVMQFFKGTNSSRLRYQGTVAQLRQYMRHKQLPYPTQRRIIEYYEFRFQRRFFRESEIIHTLSAQIRHEIRMHSCRKLVENVTFFNNLPIALLGRIVALLKSEIFLTNDVILRANHTGDCMYFIATGTVAIYTSSGKEVCHLEDGAHFGEVALVMPDERRVASVVAIEVCELYRLNRVDFARTIHPYPMLWERIKKIAIERHEKTMILSAQ
ncbi:potassium/sodium hyperpolarization-activated cyclic nucleotide-gated channel 1 [Calliopsis andreniformis]|uniref:potassium/sodium hyperpolarization-activated cyclic nucleotide-gated channel 1 n=1 Tax=Calliopsis andreniformis TaxID=337506 RepID=UPI003FCDA304